MNILDIFKKNKGFFSSLYIHSNGDFQLIELKKINTSYFPVFTYTDVLENFSEDGIFRKKPFIKKFKYLRSKMDSIAIHINSFENKKLEAEIQSALQISGFTDIRFVSKQNVYGIILPSTPNIEKMSVFFSKNNITFITTDNGEVTEIKSIPSSQLSVALVSKITAKLKQKKIFLSGISPAMLGPVDSIFYQAGIKVHLQNVWENFLDFSDGIPPLTPEESQGFIYVLSMVIPGMKEWDNISEENIEAEKDAEDGIDTEVETLEDVSLKKPTIYLPKIKKQRSEDVKSKKIMFLPKLKEKKPEDVKKVDKKIVEKEYLPKNKNQIFLPRPKNLDIWKKVKSIFASKK